MIEAKEQKVVFFPESWEGKLYNCQARLGIPQSCFFIEAIPDLIYSSSIKLNAFLKKAIQKNCFNSALCVFPTHLATTKKIRFWPKLVTKHKVGICISSFCFADSLEDFETLLISWNLNRVDSNDRLHISCQYGYPYLGILPNWEAIGAKTYHPGDYFKEDFLGSLSQMKGTWIYSGHAEAEYLRGYKHLTSEDLLANKPKKPLRATIWFTCNTLSSDSEQSVGLRWFLSGATSSILASPFPTKTDANQAICDSWLNVLKQDPNLELSQIINAVYLSNPKEFFEQLNQYFLLGICWIPLLSFKK